MKTNVSRALNLLIGAGLLGSVTVAQAQTAPSQNLGQSTYQLQMAEPKLDNTTPAPTQLPKKEPLKAGVQHHEKVGKEKKNKKFKLSQEKSRLDMQTQNGRLQSNVNNGFFDTSIQSNIGIIGVKFLCQQGYSPVVNNVFPGTPAFTAGIVPEDVIVAVDGVPTQGLNREECYDLIVGTPNTPVTLSLRHGGEFRAKTLTRMDFNDIKDPRIRQAYLSEY
ncbi:PDZ domain-containing protein [bacterium]|nr:PDZ domain-containing protein [bacterium]QQR59779.1 MAG: PDZ domain-containing protein [Candidatus Melainabacteria bacterium]